MNHVVLLCIAFFPLSSRRDMQKSRFKRKTLRFLFACVTHARVSPVHEERPKLFYSAIRNNMPLGSGDSLLSRPAFLFFLTIDSRGSSTKTNDQCEDGVCDL